MAKPVKKFPSPIMKANRIPSEGNQQTESGKPALSDKSLSAQKNSCFRTPTMSAQNRLA